MRMCATCKKIISNQSQSKERRFVFSSSVLHFSTVHGLDDVLPLFLPTLFIVILGFLVNLALAIIYECMENIYTHLHVYYLLLEENVKFPRLLPARYNVYSKKIVLMIRNKFVMW